MKIGRIGRKESIEKIERMESMESLEGVKVIEHKIDLNDFIAKGGVECVFEDNMLYMSTNRSIPSQRFNSELASINSYISLPEKYKLPLRIDITAKIDAPGLYFLLGKGRINIGTLYSDNRRIDDIVAPARKTISYHNGISMNEFIKISILYDYKEMQIIIDGEERYYSKKERYMKAPGFAPMNKEGFEFKIACDKLVNLCLKSVCITEYEQSCGISQSKAEPPIAITTNNMISLGEKPTFEKCISLLPEQIRNEIIKLDEHMKTFRELKIKRQLEKNGNKITYISSDYGFSYAIYLSNDMFDHSLQWYIITNGKPDTWHRKANGMEEVLERLYKKTPEFAERMFLNLDDCVGCYDNCLVKTSYYLKDKQKNVCHGKLKFKMSISGLEDVCIFLEEINCIVQEQHNLHRDTNKSFDECCI